MSDEYYFFKNDPNDKIWDVMPKEQRYGPMLFSFDKKKIYNFWTDYPDKMTDEEVQMFKEWNLN